MQKIIIDINVIVSSLIQKNYPFLIINDLLLENKIQICISEELFEEYLTVLARPKFSRFPDFSRRARYVLTEIELKAKYYTPKVKLNIIGDYDDNMILELADESNADFIITGNTNDFTFEKYKKTRILTPKDYWENYKPKI